MDPSSLTSGGIIATTGIGTVFFALVTLIGLITVMLGFYLLYLAISDSVYWISYARFSINSDPYGLSPVFGANEKSAVVATVVELAMSLYLIIGSKHITRILWKIKYGS